MTERNEGPESGGPGAPLRLSAADADRYIRFRRRMLEEAPWAFSATPESDLGLDREFLTAALDEEETAIFAVQAPDADELIGAVGIARAKEAKFSHRARLWGLFVAPEHRGEGLGATVVEAALDCARTWDGVDWVDVAVSENSPQAARIYQAAGFVAWGREPEVTAHEGRRFDEIHMALRLRARPGGGRT